MRSSNLPDRTVFVLAADRYIDHVDNESQALAAAARAGGFEADCPSCPGWQMDRLVGHTGNVHQWVTEILGRHATEPVDSRSLPRPPGGEANLAWFDEKSRGLVDALRSTDPDSDAWNFTSAPHKALFWFRRMAHETAMHRADADLAAGRSAPAPIDPQLAADGIDELLAYMIPMRGNPGEKLQGTIHLHASEGGEWTITLSPEGMTVTKEHGKGDVAVRGPASDLLLLISNRRSADGLEVFGDSSILEQWKEHVRL